MIKIISYKETQRQSGHITFLFFLFLAFGMILGAYSLPMFPTFFLFLIVSILCILHIRYERSSYYSNWRCVTWFRCVPGIPVSAWKSKWIDFYGNGAIMITLSALGFVDMEFIGLGFLHPFSPLFHLALVGWLGCDKIIHFAMKWKVVSYDPPGFKSTVNLVGASAILISHQWSWLTSEITSNQLMAGMAAAVGFSGLAVNYAKESFDAKRWRNNNLSSDSRYIAASKR